MTSLTNIQSIPYFIPELILVVFAVGAILLDLVNRGRNTERVAYLALVGVAATLIAVIAVGSSEKSLFLGMIRLDSFAVFFKIIILVATAVTVIFSIKSEELDPRMKGEYY
ncbi:MAG: hypothetical protein OXI86_10450, partial [Candidatus Poribacteria bacterium]|nr:hypothetical protein [Candidatus Poribacteria bacterium]